jgi:hypothetical protein
LIVDGIRIGLGRATFGAALMPQSKWDAALYDGRLLEPSSLEAAFTPATHIDDPEVEYGYRWRITGETLWHSGKSVGFRVVIVPYSKRRMTVNIH